jgi:imidazolonepropionase
MIEAVGTSPELRHTYPHEETLDAAGHVVMPGFVDPHTHLLWVGDRAAEFEMRLEGKTYLEILAAGGGILSTVRLTRQASLQQLRDETHPLKPKPVMACRLRPSCACCRLCCS